MPSSAPIRMCWSLVSGWIQLAVQWIRRGQPLNTWNTSILLSFPFSSQLTIKITRTKMQDYCLDMGNMIQLWNRFEHVQNTFEKQAPMWTFGVGGSPLLAGLGGVCLFLSLRRGGTGGVSDRRSGSVPDPMASTSPKRKPQDNKLHNNQEMELSTICRGKRSQNLT